MTQFLSKSIGILLFVVLASGCGGGSQSPTPAPPKPAETTPAEPSEIPQELEMDNEKTGGTDATQDGGPVAVQPAEPREFEPAETQTLDPALSSDPVDTPQTLPIEPLAVPKEPLPSPTETVADSNPKQPSAPSSIDPLPVPPEQTDPLGAPPSEAVANPTDVEQEVPEARHKPLFEGWDKPAIALMVSGRQHGYFEPCGCTGLANQKGGLARRFTLKQQLDNRGWPTVAMDVGNQVRRYGRQAEIKLQNTVDGLKQMNYQAIGMGPDDLRLSVGELLVLAANDGDKISPFVSANVAIIDPSLTPRFHVIEKDGKKIGITGVLGDSHHKKITDNEIVLKPAADGLREVWPKMAEQQCDLNVLLAHASLDETRALAKEFPHFDVIVTAGGADEPAFTPEKIEGTKSTLVQVGAKAMYIGVVGWFPDSDEPLKYQRVPLDDRFEDSREMLQLLASYQKQLKSAGLEGLGVKPVPHPSGRKFVGSQACADCHEGEFDIWADTTHAHALETLIHPGERSEIERHFDPECLSCHVTGWNPQGYFPYISGYQSLRKTPLMFGSGCENCHGPGSAHVAAENGDTDVTDQEMEELRQQMQLKLADAEKKCLECHDLDNSPDFHQPGAFDKYWEKVAH